MWSYFLSRVLDILVTYLRPQKNIKFCKLSFSNYYNATKSGFYDITFCCMITI